MSFAPWWRIAIGQERIIWWVGSDADLRTDSLLYRHALWLYDVVSWNKTHSIPTNKVKYTAVYFKIRVDTLNLAFICSCNAVCTVTMIIATGVQSGGFLIPIFRIVFVWEPELFTYVSWVWLFTGTYIAASSAVVNNKVYCLFLSCDKNASHIKQGLAFSVTASKIIYISAFGSSILNILL